MKRNRGDIMNKLFLKSKFKKVVIGIVIGAFLLNPVTAMAQPKKGGFMNFLVKTSSFMVKEGIKENKRKKAESEREELRKWKEQEKKDLKENRKFLHEERVEEYNEKYFPYLNRGDLEGLSNLLDNMLDGYGKDVTELTDNQLKARIRARLKNKKLNDKHHKELEKYADRKKYYNTIINYEGQSYITISPGGAITFTSPTPAFIY